MFFDERRGNAITAPPEPTVISGHTKINFVESGNDCNIANVLGDVISWQIFYSIKARLIAISR